MKKLTKKEKVLYMVHGKRWDIFVYHNINISRYGSGSSADTDNILKVHTKMIDLDLTIFKRITKRIKIFNTYIYFNTIYGGINE